MTLLEGGLTGSMGDHKPLITVVICTYNRCCVLPTALQSVCEQPIENGSYEIIVVDNNSTDNTPDVIQGFCERYSNLRYIKEPLQGLSHARNCGWRNANGTYVLYLDDDGRASEKWLSIAKEIIETIYPAVFGGPYFAFYNTPKPKWFRDAYGSHTLGDIQFLDRGYLSGGNIAFRRSILADLNGFDGDLGMCAKRMAYGEETAVIARIRDTMPSELIYYDPSFYIYHLVTARKMTLTYQLRASFGSGRGYYLAVHGNDRIRCGARRIFWSMLVTFCSFCKHCTAAFQRDRVVYPYFENYVYEHGSPELSQAGFFYEQFKSYIRQKVGTIGFLRSWVKLGD